MGERERERERDRERKIVCVRVCVRVWESVRVCGGMSESKDCWLSIAAFHTQSNACVHKYVWVGACVCVRERERERECKRVLASQQGGRETERLGKSLLSIIHVPTKDHLSSSVVRPTFNGF